MIAFVIACIHFNGADVVAADNISGVILVDGLGISGNAANAAALSRDHTSVIAAYDLTARLEAGNATGEGEIVLVVGGGVAIGSDLCAVGASRDLAVVIGKVAGDTANVKVAVNVAGEYMAVLNGATNVDSGFVNDSGAADLAGNDAYGNPPLISTLEKFRFLTVPVRDTTNP